MYFNTWVVILISFICYIILPLAVLFCKNIKVQKTLILCMFLAYIIILIVGVTAKVEIGKDKVYVHYVNTGSWANKHIFWDFSRISKWDFLINLFMLMPVGLFLAYRLNNFSFGKLMLILLGVGLLIGLTIETTQFILPIPRNVQLSDVFLNSISIALGGCQLKLYELIARRKEK